MNGLNGKTCLITGGAGSIGLATAKLMQENGARLVIVDHDADALKKAEATLGSSVWTHYVTADMRVETEVKHAVDVAVKRFGSIDVLFSNAGNFGTVAPIEVYPTEVFDDVMAVHVRGAFLLAKHAVPYMHKGGSIILTSSVAGLRGDPGVYGYITAKHALTGLMRVLAKDLAPRGIRVNTINPGPVDNAFQAAVEEDLSQIIGQDGTAFFNDAIPMHRHATPEEVAQSVMYLASSQSSFTTGITLPVDGGMSV